MQLGHHRLPTSEEQQQPALAQPAALGSVQLQVQLSLGPVCLLDCRGCCFLQRRCGAEASVVSSPSHQGLPTRLTVAEADASADSRGMAQWLNGAECGEMWSTTRDWQTFEIASKQHLPGHCAPTRQTGLARSCWGDATVEVTHQTRSASLVQLSALFCVNCCHAAAPKDCRRDPMHFVGHLSHWVHIAVVLVCMSGRELGRKQLRLHRKLQALRRGPGQSVLIHHMHQG